MIHFKTEGLKSFWRITIFCNRYYMFLEFWCRRPSYVFPGNTGELTAVFDHYHARWFSTRARYRCRLTIERMINVLVINCTRRLTCINQVRRENLTACTLMRPTVPSNKTGNKKIIRKKTCRDSRGAEIIASMFSSKTLEDEKRTIERFFNRFFNQSLLKWETSDITRIKKRFQR